MCISCSNEYFDVNTSPTTRGEVSPRIKTEVKDFSSLTSTEKNDIANLVLANNNLYYKGYEQVGDYYGIVYYKTESTISLLQSTYNTFSDTRYLRANEANGQALFIYMGFRYVNPPTTPPAGPSEIKVIHSGITFVVPLKISQQIMNDYNCTFGVIKNATEKVAAAQTGNGIRVNLESNPQKYTSELKIQVMGDKRVFTKDTGTTRTFNIIAAGLH